MTTEHNMKIFIALCRPLAIELSDRTLRCYLFAVLYYGLEVWTLQQEHMDKLWSLEMWCYRRMLRISWTERRTSMDVLREMDLKPLDFYMSTETNSSEEFHPRSDEVKNNMEDYNWEREQRRSLITS
ncbi:hypothetical protein HUJ04_003906 [Dendroctonus ponderosae]|nr:hypothetical protein HUJ04_003906 [Dendroctonus ponderosae]